jgi:hypothetical protein
VPLWWPFRRRRTVFLGPLAFRTSGWAEALGCFGVVAGVGYRVSFRLDGEDLLGYTYNVQVGG